MNESAEGNRILTISQLTAHVRGVLENDRLLQNVWVRGEISDFKFYQKSGHMYFNLKDDEASVNCVMFRGKARNIDFQPHDGLKVIASGYISIFEKYGRYQFYVEDMEPDGLGRLFLSLTQLKEKLEKEGLFDPQRKRPLPRFVNCLGIVTSGDGAALRDIVRVVRQRHPGCQIVVASTAVQGAEAPGEIVRAIEAFNQWGQAEVLIVGRGGGSIEDLWAFNTEPVVRAVAGSTIPIISAVGHEVDVSLADFAADVRAATPTQAGQLAVPDMLAFSEQIKDIHRRQVRAMERIITMKSSRLDNLRDKKVWKRPDMLIESRLRDLNRAMEEMSRAVQNRVKNQEISLGRAAAALEALSPLKVLERGYAIVRRRDGGVVRTIGQVEAGEVLTVTVSDGEITVKAIEKKTGDWVL